MESSLRAPQKTSSTDSSIVEVSGPLDVVFSSKRIETTENAGQSRKFVPLDPEKFKTAVQQGGISAKKSQRGALSLSLVIDCHLT